MIFTSYTYLFFLAAVFAIYWASPRGWRRPILIAASYFFYCTWDWRFGFLLLGVSVFNWAYGLWLSKRPELSWELWAGIGVNLLPLIYFKYTNFILANLSSLSRISGGGWEYHPMAIILPLGISFFTFQGVAYLVDIWAGGEPFSDLRDFLLFKAFWPQLIAGPIIRAHEIHEQISSDRRIGYKDISYGCQRILFGFFKKAVFADSIAPLIDPVFLHGSSPNAVDAMLGAIGFGLQIYFDFSAYSDIAIGSARLFGFKFPENFNWPYASSSPQDFWNRWHMTLSRWIRDYVFTPIRFATRDYPRMAMLWLLAAMTICGLWHGAQWTFVLWGVWHGVLLVANQTVLKNLWPSKHKTFESAGAVFSYLVAIGSVYLAVNLAWILFRSPGMADAAGIFGAIFSLKGGLRPGILRENSVLFITLVVTGLFLAQALKARIDSFFSAESSRPILPAMRALVYSLIVVAIAVFEQSSKAFVYFQF